MLAVINSGQMKAYDKNTIEYFGMPSLVLMERAALSVISELQKSQVDLSHCLIVCGWGNNGGDGLAIARMLFQLGKQVEIVLPQKNHKLSPETQIQLGIINQYKVPVFEEIPNNIYTVVIDALFGIGLSRELQGQAAELVKKMNSLVAAKVAVDIPSGISADHGHVMGAAFYADITVTFAFPKVGLLLYPGYEYAGRIVIMDIGIDHYSFRDARPNMHILTKEDLHMLPQRSVNGNKGSFGKVLIIAGQKNMAGAAFLSGKAAAVTGCGMVKVFTVEENRTIIQTLLPEAILETWSTNEEQMSSKLTQAMAWADVVVAGPGLGVSEQTKLQVELALAQQQIPVILDADALNVAAADLQLLQNHQAAIVITPHLGEMSRLQGQTIAEIQKDPLAAAKKMTQEYGVICVLKDARTITAVPDGNIFINCSGNNGMATAGAGDVLTGIIAGLLAQQTKPENAAALAVYLHGAAGDYMADETGTYGLMASDIISGLPYAMNPLQKKSG